MITSIEFDFLETLSKHWEGDLRERWADIINAQKALDNSGEDVIGINILRQELNTRKEMFVNAYLGVKAKELTEIEILRSDLDHIEQENFALNIELDELQEKYKDLLKQVQSQERLDKSA